MSPVAVSSDFNRAPSVGRVSAVAITSASAPPAGAHAVGLLIDTGADVPDLVGLDRVALAAAGFDGAVGQTLVVPRADGPPVVIAGVGDLTELDADGVRNAVGSLSRAAGTAVHLALVVPAVDGLTDDLAAQVAVEAALLARYRFDVLQTGRAAAPLGAITLVVDDSRAASVLLGAERGRSLAGAMMLARDLANCPPTHLTATAMADVAERVGGAVGLEVEVFEQAALHEMGCGGLLGVNAGSAEEARMVRLTYTPPGAPTGHLSLVGKGIMYDSGGISLKPADGTHATMKNDMSGAAAVLAAMTALPALACPTAVTGYLMCTDNMPSGTALRMGDVLTMRGGTTVEVRNTDAEGRLVMGDALVLATEGPTDAIVDIATLTGACLRALGPEIAGVIGNHDGLIAQIKAAAEAADEPVWELPLARRYRKYLDTDIADIDNLGSGADAGAITAALFLEEFVAGRPWAHIDIAGTAQAAAPDGWRAAGRTGFGARLLVELALSFAPPKT